MTAQEREKLARIDRALTIAADMFAAEGYCAANGDDSPAAIRRFLIKKARVELEAENEPYERPCFLGKEVTGDVKYYNSFLIRHPYSEWNE